MPCAAWYRDVRIVLFEIVERPREALVRRGAPRVKSPP
jgi:hypothetical protein